VHAATAYTLFAGKATSKTGIMPPPVPPRKAPNAARQGIRTASTPWAIPS